MKTPLALAILKFQINNNEKNCDDNNNKRCTLTLNIIINQVTIML